MDASEKVRAKTASFKTRPAVPKLTFSQPSQIIDIPTPMISPFRKERLTSRVLVHVPHIPLETIQEFKLNSVGSSTPHVEEESTYSIKHTPRPNVTTESIAANNTSNISTPRRYKQRSSSSSNAVTEDMSWYMNWKNSDKKPKTAGDKSTGSLSSRSSVDSSPRAQLSGRLYDSSIKSPLSARKMQDTAQQEEKRRASYYFYNELMEMDFRQAFPEEKREPPTYEEHIYLVNLKIQELTQIFREKLRKQYELMTQEMQIEEANHKNELNNAKKQYEAKMNGLLQTYQTFRTDKLDLAKNKHENAVMKRRFLDMDDKIKQLEIKDQENKQKYAKLLRENRITTFKSIIKNMTKGRDDEFTNRDRSQIENEPQVVGSVELQKFILDEDGNINQAALVNILAVNHELTDQLKRTRATTQHLHDKVLILQDTIESQKKRIQEEFSSDDDEIPASDGKLSSMNIETRAGSTVDSPILEYGKSSIKNDDDNGIDLNNYSLTSAPPPPMSIHLANQNQRMSEIVSQPSLTSPRRRKKSVTITSSVSLVGQEEPDPDENVDEKYKQVASTNRKMQKQLSYLYECIMKVHEPIQEVSGLVDKITKIILCGYCGSVIINGHILSCGHTYCENCLHALMEGDLMECATCKVTTQDQAVCNRILNSILKLLGSLLSDLMSVVGMSNEMLIEVKSNKLIETVVSGGRRQSIWSLPPTTIGIS
ncbi:BRE1 [Acrasis kona]|uniref:BRE1 n=1 Tax=Acrasis kona TaxID=1008807 RepID=A0AAW2ZG45_9EUKA